VWSAGAKLPLALPFRGSAFPLGRQRLPQRDWEGNAIPEGFQSGGTPPHSKVGRGPAVPRGRALDFRSCRGGVSRRGARIEGRRVAARRGQ